MTLTKHEVRRRLAFHTRRLRGPLSLNEVARRCGWTASMVKRIEDGETVPGFDKVQQLAEAFGVPTDEFVLPVPAGESVPANSA